MAMPYTRKGGYARRKRRALDKASRRAGATSYGARLAARRRTRRTPRGKTLVELPMSEEFNGLNPEEYLVVERRLKKATDLALSRGKR